MLALGLIVQQCSAGGLELPASTWLRGKKFLLSFVIFSTLQRKTGPKS